MIGAARADIIPIEKEMISPPGGVCYGACHDVGLGKPAVRRRAAAPSRNLKRN